MAQVAANYNINMDEFAADMAAEGLQSAEVEAIMKAVGENKMDAKLRSSRGGPTAPKRNAKLPYLVVGGPTAQHEDQKQKVPTDAIKMAKFAVEQYNKKNGTHLVYVDVVDYVESVETAGTVHELLIETEDDGGTYTDEAKTFKYKKTGKKILARYKH